MKSTLSCVRECISHLQEKFSTCPALYFSESDLQSELFALLLNQFGHNCEITDVFVWGTDQINRTKQCISRRLHSELLLPEGRIDLAILDLAHARFAMNSRGQFEHIQLKAGDHVFIEIKASRTNRSKISSKTIWVKSILSDIRKLNNYAHPCFMICFDFSGLLNDSEASLLIQQANSNVEVIYTISETKDNWLANNSLP